MFNVKCAFLHFQQKLPLSLEFVQSLRCIDCEPTQIARRSRIGTLVVRYDEDVRVERAVRLQTR